ncbi:McrB family protein [Paenibacillus sp. PSB04]|uniref:McrB family protein n=1 Tax=Paenibacillus sp. PSB04 TaxID=2866810 RepID=UPI0021F0AA4C|nr:AAA family ATPase [Paenibacillus sp. PSB04]UYO06435.1 AAA family ATPase [Paenibacillus sp. PSB04]
MIKTLRSWWKDSEIPNLIGRKKVDFSIFEYGTQIPVEFHVDFSEANQGKAPALGTSQKIVFIYKNQTFEARLQNVDQKSADREALQIRYDSNKELKQFMISQFQATYQYITAKKAENTGKKNIVVPDAQAEYIEFYATGSPFEYRIELITQQGTPNVWWVNQGNTIYAGKTEGVIWAPLKNSNGNSVHHWETMREVKRGDIILHYANKHLRYVSRVIDPAQIAPRPSSFANSNWEEEGRLVRTDYYEISPAIPLELFNQQLMKLNITQGPLNSIGGVNQGYLYRFTIPGLQLIQHLSKDVNWPTFTQFEIANPVMEETITLPEIKDEDVRETVNQIKAFIKQNGFHYSDPLIENFYLSLKTKPFVILAGISGTGKTKLVKLFAESVGATGESGQFTLIPVRPDWNDPSDLIGYQDLSGRFKPGRLTEVMVTASLPENRNKPYFICLDEMNLARVEHYFSDLLSLLESQRWMDGQIVTEPLIPYTSLDRLEDQEFYGDLGIPENVYLIGTVNMDETTYPFSKKVLDRANTLEFNHIDLTQLPWSEGDEEQEIVEIAPVSQRFFRADYLNLVNVDAENKELVKRTTNRLVAINQILEEIHAQVGFRIRDTISFYSIYAERFGLLTEDEAFDLQLLQKILPRIQGSHTSVKRVLLKLLKVCLEGESLKVNDLLDDASPLYSRWEAGKEAPAAKYRQSARKLAFMLRRLEEDGFTSFWLS